MEILWYRIIELSSSQKTIPNLKSIRRAHLFTSARRLKHLWIIVTALTNTAVAYGKEKVPKRYVERCELWMIVVLAGIIWPYWQIDKLTWNIISANLIMAVASWSLTATNPMAGPPQYLRKMSITREGFTCLFVNPPCKTNNKPSAWWVGNAVVKTYAASISSFCCNTHCREHFLWSLHHHRSKQDFLRGFLYLSHDKTY